MRTSSDIISLSKSEFNYIKIPIIQGQIENQTVTGTGEAFQTFNIQTGGPTAHDQVKVAVNGESWTIYNSLYDMNNGEESVMVKTSVNGGITIFFGNKQFGEPPALGSIIKVTYVKTRGSAGNIGGKNIDLKFKDPGTDSQGNEVNLDEVLSLNIVRNPMFGSDSEDPQFTRLIAPYQSNSFVLANPNNYIYYLSKYDFFSFVDAYNTKDDQYLDDDNIIYLFLIPDIAKKITSDRDYFNVPVEEFTLTADEKEMVYEILNESGRQIVTAEVRINDPVVKRYAMNIVIRYVEGFDKDEIHASIREQLSTYFIYINRRDRIPRSDIISIIENVDGVDSVNVFFISEENEKAIRDGFYEVPVYGTDPVTDQRVLIETNKITIRADEDPQLGLDEFGDVVIGPEDLAIIRGGWDDRNGSYYEATPNKNALSSLNIFFKGTIPNNLYNKTQQAKFNDLKRSRGTTIATGGNSRSTNTGRLQDNPTLKAIRGK